MDLCIFENLIDKIKEIFIIYIIILTKFNIIDEYEAIKIFYGFYRKNYNLFVDKNFFFKIIHILALINPADITVKYITFIYIIYSLDKTNIELINLYNRCKLIKNQDKIIINNLETNNLQELNTNFNIMSNKLCQLKTYLNSYGILGDNNFFKYFLFIKDEYIKKIQKNELINRIELLKNMLGARFINFILNKEERKKKKNKIYLYDRDYLEMMTYDEIIKYIFLLFSEIHENIDKYMRDIEFNKYLKIIIICYIDENNDKISLKFHQKILKKYIKNTKKIAYKS